MTTSYRDIVIGDTVRISGSELDTAFRVDELDLNHQNFDGVGPHARLSYNGIDVGWEWCDLLVPVATSGADAEGARE